MSDCSDIEVQEDLDDAGFWAVVPSGLGLHFDTEAEACDFQRDWRFLHNLDPMTGEEL